MLSLALSCGEEPCGWLAGLGYVFVLLMVMGTYLLAAYAFYRVMRWTWRKLARR